MCVMDHSKLFFKTQVTLMIHFKVQRFILVSTHKESHYMYRVLPYAKKYAVYLLKPLRNAARGDVCVRRYPDIFVPVASSFDHREALEWVPKGIFGTDGTKGNMHASLCDVMQL